MKRRPASLCILGFLAAGCGAHGCSNSPDNSAESTDTITNSVPHDDTASDTHSDTVLPESCQAASAACGVIRLLGGTWTDCGKCPPPSTCGALEPNQCGCDPVTCAFAGADCGAIDDGCGHTLECGTCSGLATCGGALMPNVCAAPVCNDYCWCSITPYPQANDLSLVYYDGRDESLWVGGADSQLLVRRSGVWSIASTYTRQPSQLHAMALFGPEEGWVVGENGAVLKNEGTRFHCSYLDSKGKTKYWSPVTYDLFDLWAASAESLWVAGAKGVLHWDGQSWTEARPSAGVLYTVAGMDENDLWFGGTRDNAPFLFRKHGNVFSSADLGLPQLRGIISDLVLSSAGTLLAAGIETDASGAEIGGFLLRKTGEDKWERLDAGNLHAGLRSCAFDDAGVLLCAGERGSLAIYDGAAVLPAPALLGRKALRAVALSASSLVVVGQTGFIAQTAHGFLFPNLATSPVASGQPEAVSMALSQDAQVFGGNGFALLFRGTSFGYAPVNASITGLVGFGPRQVFAAGNSGSDAVILHYDGASWTEVARAEGEVASSIEGTSTTDVRARLSSENRILHFNGKTASILEEDDLPAVPAKAQTRAPWTITDQGFQRNAESGTELLRTWPVDGLQERPHRTAGAKGQMWSVGKDGAIWFDGENWKRVAANVEMTDVAVDSDGVVWITGDANDQGGPLWHLDGELLADAGFEAESVLHAISIAPDGNAFVAGEGIHHLEAQQWVEVLKGNGTPILDIAALSDTDIWAARGFDVLHLEEGEWVTRPTTDIQTIPPLFGEPRVVVHTIFALSPEEVLIAGENPDKSCFVMIGYQSGAFSSRPMCSTDGEAAISDLWALSADDAFVTISQVGEVYHYVHALGLFDYVDAVTSGSLGALWGNAQGYKWALGARGVIMRGVPLSDPNCQ
ncbi:MAG: hypothetical protein MUC50_06395 [Myxococcota bacterium]|jgi:hypothetical protein|nr:hypothetical protein [Myxococcota bacterium]